MSSKKYVEISFFLCDNCVMGVQILTDKQVAFVEKKVASVVNRRNLTNTECARLAGYGTPDVRSAELMANPLVRKAIVDALDDLGCDADRVATVFDRNLDNENGAIQLRAAEDIAKLRGEMIDRGNRDAASNQFNFVIVLGDGENAGPSIPSHQQADSSVPSAD
jgi:hypothetical protein